jgi:DNA-binding response OmpR family regulator
VNSGIGSIFYLALIDQVFDSVICKIGIDKTGPESDQERKMVNFTRFSGLDDQPERAFDLIISDLRMPVSSGLLILRGLRNSGWRVPFILCTAFGDEQTRTETERLDAIFFDKPFELDDLRKAVRSILSPSEVR